MWNLNAQSVLVSVIKLEESGNLGEHLGDGCSARVLSCIWVGKGAGQRFYFFTQDPICRQPLGLKYSLELKKEDKIWASNERMRPDLQGVCSVSPSVCDLKVVNDYGTEDNWCSCKAEEDQAVIRGRKTRLEKKKKGFSNRVSVFRN